MNDNVSTNNITIHIFIFIMSYYIALPRTIWFLICNMAWVRAQLCKLQKRCTRLAAASDQVYQLLVHGQWFSPGTPALELQNILVYI
jgi:hypothetical protein